MRCGRKGYAIEQRSMLRPSNGDSVLDVHQGAIWGQAARFPHARMHQISRHLLHWQWEG